MEHTFHNVAITIGGSKDAAEAYTRLCNALATIGNVEYDTDTYTESKGRLLETEPRSTVELMQKAACPHLDSVWVGNDQSMCTRCKAYLG